MEVSKVRQWWDKLQELARSAPAKKLLTVLGSFLSGLLCSRGLVFGRYAPFGVAAVAAVPKEGLWAAAAGAALGYLLPSPASLTIRYITAVVAVSAIRWSLAELKRVSGHALFAPIVSFVALLLTGGTMVFLSGSLGYKAVLYLAESFLGAGVSYFLCRAVKLLDRPGTTLDNGDTAALAVSIGVLVLSFSEFTISGVSLGRIAMTLLVLLCARQGGIGGGAVSGVTAGALQGLSTAGLSHLSGAYGLGGLMAGVFAPLGKVATAVSFILSFGVASLQAGQATGVLLTGAIEVAAATLLYMVLPGSQALSQLFRRQSEALPGTALRDSIVLRLRRTSQALGGVCDSVEEVSEKLEKVCAPTSQQVFDRAAGTVCSGCPKSTVCWTKYKDDMLGDLAALTPLLKEHGRVAQEDLSPALRERCSRSAELRDQVNREYARFLVREAADLRATQVREAAGVQFRATAGILDGLAQEFTESQRFDEEAARRIADVLRENGAEPLEVCCRIDPFDRMTVEAELRKDKSRRLNKAVFTKEISAACGRVFSPPCVTADGDRCRLRMSQRPAYSVTRGFAQLCAGGGAFCGDSTTVFEDGSGRLLALLSDGMGTGGLAAVDGAMTCSMAETLLKAGVDFDQTLQTVNAALLTKAGEEALVTLDCVMLDLFTGDAVFRKAGAAATLVRRGSRVETLEAPSVPVGILPEARAAEFHRTLSPGDIILLLSDGVAVCGTQWIADLLLHWDDSLNPNVLAQQITEEAKKRRADGHEDDVTVLALELH